MLGFRNATLNLGTIMTWSQRITRIALIIGLSAAAVDARATVLLNLVNPPAATNQPHSLSFVASQTTTQVNIAGYQVPALEFVSDNQVLLNNTGSNLLGPYWSFTPAPAGSDSSQQSDGTSVNEISFAGTSAGYYDVYSQTISTIIGDTYFVDFDFTNEGPYSPSALLVNTGAVIDAAPEPATWGLMLLGVGLMGATLRMARRKGAPLQLSHARLIRF